MKDIPIFTTQNGVASLKLKEIPYTKSAYIQIQDSLSPELFLEECIGFCKAVGAEQIFATGHAYLHTWKKHAEIWQLSLNCAAIADTDASLMPITEQTLSQWRLIYNEKMADVACFSYMTQSDANALLKKGGGYFIHKGGTLLGIGMASGNRIDAVVSVVKGSGETLIRALVHAISSDVVTLEVASTNEKALRLYNKMGFIRTQCLRTWYVYQK